MVEKLPSEVDKAMFYSNVYLALNNSPHMCISDTATFSETVTMSL